MAAPSRPASPLFLREDELRRGIELLHFGQGALLRAVDQRLSQAGLGRAHHRALYFIARQPDLTVTTLMSLLAVTKQSLNRTLSELASRDLVETRVGRDDRRQRLLRLTPEGLTLENELFEALKSRISAAYVEAGPAAVAGFWQVLDGLVPSTERARIAKLKS